MAKLNVKLWNKTASNASWYENRPAVSIFPDKNEGMIYCTGHEWVNGKNNIPKSKPITKCIIEIEEEGYGIVFNGTFKELCDKLK